MTNEDIELLGRIHGMTVAQDVIGFARALLSRAIPEGHVVVPGWMPIETAPKDGQLVLLCNRKGNHGDGYWLKEAYSGNGAWIWTYIHREPTHWMPLPAAPAPEGEA